ncbi:unnamed protein product [Didymodactylos carnosus]|uniref:G-protein coupled receptors family 1 profile domain-containing protein n=1 Tax=Didymodactylos carnosus TaxID=1234261 RepID=A0A815NXA4_9BILA|nr:unnamed protein product [Didymodactylos carnosus]CAF1440287.1 unnamed protein product [Didymodactylos carnosus]CAF4108874.1 unnamed protein product [Didymodactylos carnosus]CAF4316686.1 unnamed protein product [Didymodactylos carnosus]
MSSSNSSTTTTQLQYAQEQLNRYMPMVLLIFGSFGNILNVIILTRKQLCTNPTSTYFLASTLAGCTALLFGSLLRVLDGYYIYPTAASDLYCKVRVFLNFFSLSLASWFIVLACVDRYVSSSKNVKIRSFSSVKTAKRAIGLMTILICSLFSPMLYCIRGMWAAAVLNCGPPSPTCQQYNSFNVLINLSLLPPLLMLIFGLLTVRNVRSIARRIVPSTTTTTIGVPSRMKNKDRQLTVMLIVQVAFITIISLPFSVDRIYAVLTISLVKSNERQDIENFLYTLLNLVQFINSATSFYLFTLTGTIFRQELKRLIFYYLPRISTTNETTTKRKTQLELSTIKH